MKVLVIGGTGNISRGIVAALQTETMKLSYSTADNTEIHHLPMSASSTVIGKIARILRRKSVRKSGMQ